MDPRSIVYFFFFFKFYYCWLRATRLSSFIKTWIVKRGVSKLRECSHDTGATFIPMWPPPPEFTPVLSFSSVLVYMIQHHGNVIPESGSARSLYRSGSFIPIRKFTPGSCGRGKTVSYPVRFWTHLRRCQEPGGVKLSLPYKQLM